MPFDAFVFKLGFSEVQASSPARTKALWLLLYWGLKRRLLAENSHGGAVCFKTLELMLCMQVVL